MMASEMGGVGGVSARSALTALMVRRGAEGAVNTARNLPPHHLHIYMQGVVGWWFRLKCGVEQGVVNRRVNR